MVSGIELTPRASVGIAWTVGGGADVDRLIAAADAAMYQSKAQGLGRPIIDVLDAASLPGSASLASTGRPAAA
jgi:GGDEF domain-containing protein